MSQADSNFWGSKYQHFKNLESPGFHSGNMRGIAGKSERELIPPREALPDASLYLSCIYWIYQRTFHPRRGSLGFKVGTHVRKWFSK
jgi:hypothetical protein